MKFLVLCASLLTFTANCSPADPAKRPNILFIMSDDHAAHAISAYGSKVNKTPHLDSIGANGIRFQNCFAVNSICTPSRATILTGKYSHMNGVPVFNTFDGSQPHVARYLQQAGYYTGIIGKWHLGSEPTGFDHWEVVPGQGLYQDPVFITGNGRRVVKGYATDVITDLTIDFLKNRPKERPFFLMSHHKAPHRNWVPDAQHKAMFSGKHIPEPATLRDDHKGRADAIKECNQMVFKDLTRRDLKLEPPQGISPAERNRWLGEVPDEVTLQEQGKKRTLKGDELRAWMYQRYMQDYLACVQSVDDNIGRLLAWMKDNGLYENTVVIYTSDQGFFLGDHGLYDKRFMYEESIRMPFLVQWPGVIKPGKVEKALAINPDFAPTFMEIAGLQPAADMQGRSLVPLFRGKKPSDWRTSFYYRYYHDPGDHNTRAHYGIRTETQKLVHFWKQDQWELYDLRQDPEELHNVYAESRYSKVISRLKDDLQRLKAELGDTDQFSNQLPAHGVDQPTLQKSGRPK